MELLYGKSAYERTEGDLPELPLVNMWVEDTRSDGVVLLSRPGLQTSYTYGAASIDALLKRAGLFAEAIFAVSGTTVYKAGVSLGSITGTGAVSLAYTGDDADADDQLLIARGAGLWRYVTAGLSAVTFPGSLNIIKVVYLSGYFIAVPENSQRFHFSAVLDGSVFDALDFATAEKEPDQIRDVVVLNDMLVLLGARTTEFWQITGDSVLPFVPITGRVIDRGIHSTGCAQNIDNTVFWIGEDNIVYRLGDAGIPLAISDQGIEERITESTTAQLWQFEYQGNKFLCVRLDAGTWAHNIRTGQWSEFKSYGKANWLPRCGDAGLFGSSEAGGVLSFAASYDDFGSVHERRFRAGTPLNGGAVGIDNLRIRSNVGQTSYLTGDYADPVVEMRQSRDAGQTWGNWKSRKMGAQGKYKKRVEWRALGKFREPGALFEFRVTDPIPWRLSSVAVNEPTGGRP